MLVVFLYSSFLGGISPVFSDNSVTKKLEQDDVFLVKEDDPLMLLAYKKAKETKNDFLKSAEHPPIAWTSYSVKVKLIDGEKEEFGWISSFKKNTDQTFSGILVNQPVYLKNYKLGSKVTFDYDSILDWTYSDSEASHGNYTSCAILKISSPREYENLIERLRLDCSWLPH